MIDIRSAEFKAKYSWPKENDIDSLFRFYSFDQDKLHFARALFVQKNLFHNTPANFNDPFECSPYFQWPSSKAEKDALIEDVIDLLVFTGISFQQAQEFCRQNLNTPEFRILVETTLVTMLQTFRICCFTTSKDNLLFWSHYADAHKGYCIEFGTQYPVFAQAYSVRYSSSYPVLKSPLFKDLSELQKLFSQPNFESRLSELNLGFSLVEPVLNKSKEWSYEDEYRSIIMPSAPMQVLNDGFSAKLTGNEIKNVYFGCGMPNEHRDQLISIINEGPFTPGLWQASRNPNEFSLSFSMI